MFVVLGLLKELELNIGVKLKASSYDEGCIGFLPVYATKAEAKKAYPDYKILELEE
jgi:hypothetical protein